MSFIAVRAASRAEESPEASPSGGKKIAGGTPRGVLDDLTAVHADGGGDRLVCQSRCLGRLSRLHDGEADDNSRSDDGKYDDEKQGVSCASSYGPPCVFEYHGLPFLDDGLDNGLNDGSMDGIRSNALNHDAVCALWRPYHRLPMSGIAGIQLAGACARECLSSVRVRIA